MPLTTRDAVLARLERLERESRRWRRAALGAWLAIAALLLFGQASPRAAGPGSPGRTVEAERFVLRDARGRIGARSVGRRTTPRASRSTARAASPARC